MSRASMRTTSPFRDRLQRQLERMEQAAARRRGRAARCATSTSTARPGMCTAVRSGPARCAGSLSSAHPSSIQPSSSIASGSIGSACATTPPSSRARTTTSGRGSCGYCDGANLAEPLVLKRVHAGAGVAAARGRAGVLPAPGRPSGDLAHGSERRRRRRLARRRPQGARQSSPIHPAARRVRTAARQRPRRALGGVPRALQPEAEVMTRVVVVSPEPTPYRAPLFDALATRPDIDLTVIYAADTVAGRTGRSSRAIPAVFLAGPACRARTASSGTTIRSRRASSASCRARGRDCVVVSGWSTVRLTGGDRLVPGATRAVRAAWSRAMTTARVPPWRRAVKDTVVAAGRPRRGRACSRLVRRRADSVLARGRGRKTCASSPTRSTSSAGGARGGARPSARRAACWPRDRPDDVAVLCVVAACVRRRASTRSRTARAPGGRSQLPPHRRQRPRAHGPRRSRRMSPPTSSRSCLAHEPWGVVVERSRRVRAAARPLRPRRRRARPAPRRRERLPRPGGRRAGGGRRAAAARRRRRAATPHGRRVRASSCATGATSRRSRTSSRPSARRPRGRSPPGASATRSQDVRRAATGAAARERARKLVVGEDAPDRAHAQPLRSYGHDERLAVLEEARDRRSGRRRSRACPPRPPPPRPCRSSRRRRRGRRRPPADRDRVAAPSDIGSVCTAVALGRDTPSADASSGPRSTRWALGQLAQRLEQVLDALSPTRSGRRRARAARPRECRAARAGRRSSTRRPGSGKPLPRTCTRSAGDAARDDVVALPLGRDDDRRRAPARDAAIERRVETRFSAHLAQPRLGTCRAARRRTGRRAGGTTRPCRC